MNSDPWLSIVIPTVGRPSLADTLLSWERQPAAAGIEVLVVADAHGGRTGAWAAEEIVGEHLWTEARSGATYKFVEHDGGQHCWGHPQRTEGARRASAPWVAFSQDDNIASATALASIRTFIQQQDQPRPLFFKCRVFWGELVWRSPHLALGDIDADCLVFPKALAEQVVWGQRYEGDYDAALDAARKAGWNIGWCDEVIAVARPRPEEYWWRS